MSPALKNRLVGTIIVVAVAVIFLPDLLDGRKESKRDLFVDLPPTPDIKAVKAPTKFDTSKVKQAVTRKIEVISEQALDDDISETEVESNSSIDNAATEVEKKISEDDPLQVQTYDNNNVKQASNENSLAIQTVVEESSQTPERAGWVVQLGSFRHQKNVKELLVKLEKGGYRAFSRPVKTSSGTLTKVFVGPDLDKTKLNNALSHLKQLTNLQGRVTPFTVQ